jgi:hypothetical protein
MEFEGQYLSYEEYRGLGGTLDQMPFNILEYEIRKKIDLETQDRLINCEEIPTSVKMCEFRLIDTLLTYSNQENENKNIASENTDGYSVSYVTGSQIKELIKSKNAEIEDIILDYLFGTIINGEHIIYNGVR